MYIVFCTIQPITYINIPKSQQKPTFSTQQTQKKRAGAKAPAQNLYIRFNINP